MENIEAEGKKKIERTPRFFVGQQWILFFANGMKRDTVIKIIDNFRIEMAGAGIVQKSWLDTYWYQMDKWFPLPSPQTTLPK